MEPRALVLAPLFLQLLMDEHPSAVHLGVDLALAVVGAAAGPVQKALGAAGDRAYGPVFLYDAGAAVGALLDEVHGAADVAQKQGVGAGDDMLVGRRAYGLGAGAAGQDDERLCIVHSSLVLAQDALHVQLRAAGMHDIGGQDLLAGLFEDGLHLGHSFLRRLSDLWRTRPARMMTLVSPQGLMISSAAFLGNDQLALLRYPGDGLLFSSCRRAALSVYGSIMW